MYSIYATVGGATVCLHDDTVANPRVKVIDPTLTLEDNSAGSLIFKLAPNNVGYGEYTITEYVTSGEVSPSSSYSLTTSEPPGWITDFASYYTESGGEYTSVKAAAPTFVAGQYYGYTTDAHGDPVYYVLDNAPTDWAHTYTNYFYKSGDDYLPIPAGPAWAEGTYYAKNTEDGVVPMTRTVDLVDKMASNVTVFRTNQNGQKTEIWSGRVLSENNDFNNLREIYCEGELAFLNDTIQPQKDYPLSTFRQIIEAILSIHNGKVEESKKFFVGKVVLDNDSVDARRTDYGSTWDAIKSLIEDYKCHVEIRKANGLRYLDFFSDYPRISSQVIRLGSNLLDFTRSWNMANLATAVLPTGAITESATSSSVGEPLTPTSTKTGSILYVDSNDGNAVKIRSSNVSDYVIKTYTVEADKNYYLSSRLHNGYAAWVLYTQGGKQVSYKTSGRNGEKGFEDRVDEKITIPPSEVGNTYTVKVCSWGKDITAKLKAEIPPTEGFDKYVTVVDVGSVTGFTLLVSMPDDWFTNYTAYYRATYTSVQPVSGHAPTFVAGQYYEYSDIYGYTALIDQPTDWGTNYGNYYIKTSGYTPVTGALPPAWKENTYYRRTVWHTAGSPYVINQDAVTRYGWIEKHLEYSDIEDADALCEAAKTYLESGQFDEMTIEISAIDLSSIGVDYEAIRLLDKVQVVSEPHGMNKLFPVTKLEIPLNNPAEQRFTLGYSSEEDTISAASTEAVATVNEKIAGIPSMSSILESAQQNAAQIINTSQSGYITFVKDANGKPYEMIISEGENYLDPADQKMWKFNQGGLGYFPHGYTSGNVNLALTMDGKINADFITAGTMAAERIYGGTLSIGYLDSSNDGVISVYDSDGNEICRFDEYGGNIYGNGKMRTTNVTGNGTFYAEQAYGKIMGGKITNGNAEEWGRLDCRITYDNHHGLSLEAYRQSHTDSDPNVGTRTDYVANGIISLCAGEIILAPRYAGIIAYKCQNATVNIGQSLSIAQEYSVQNTQPTDWSTSYTKYYTRSGTAGNYTYTKVPEGSGPPAWASDTYYLPSSKKLQLKGKAHTFVNGFLVDIANSETVLSEVTLPNSSESDSESQLSLS